jgi:hypothetical protein
MKKIKIIYNVCPNEIKNKIILSGNEKSDEFIE